MLFRIELAVRTSGFAVKLAHKPAVQPALHALTSLCAGNMLHAIADVLRVAGERFERITNLAVRMGSHLVIRAFAGWQVMLLTM